MLVHTMALMQAYQADFFKDLDEGEGPISGDLVELRRAADLSLRVTKETACAIGHSMAVYLWLNLSGIKEKFSWMPRYRLLACSATQSIWLSRGFKSS